MVDIRSSRALPSSPGIKPMLDLRADVLQTADFIDGQEKMVRLAERIVKDALSTRRFKLRMSLFLRFHKTGYDFLNEEAGLFRSVPVFIEKSQLAPPSANEVVELLEGLCDYVNENWGNSSATQLGAYVMWRFLWIHPFVDGNGSIARLICYMVMQIKSGYEFPGTRHMFGLIADNRGEYYAALSEADEHWKQGQLILSRLEAFLENMLSQQLASAS